MGSFEVYLATGLLGALVTVLWWGIRRLIGGQDAIGADLGTVKLSLVDLSGKLSAVGQWQHQHEQLDATRHEANASEASQIRALVTDALDRELVRGGRRG